MKTLSPNPYAYKHTTEPFPLQTMEGFAESELQNGHHGLNSKPIALTQKPTRETLETLKP